MIVDKNGIINIQNLGLKLGPEVTLDDFKKNSHFGVIKYLGSNGDYERYKISNASIEDLYFSIVIFFYKKKISQIGLFYIHKYLLREDTKSPKEIVYFSINKYDEWMVEQHGAIIKKYPWGLIKSGLKNLHGYDTGIFVLYNSPVNELIIQRFKED